MVWTRLVGWTTVLEKLQLVAWTATLVFVSASDPRTLRLKIQELVLCDFIDIVTYCEASLLDIWRLNDTV